MAILHFYSDIQILLLQDYFPLAAKGVQLRSDICSGICVVSSGSGILAISSGIYVVSSGIFVISSGIFVV